jgi:hypothetical protein
MGHIRGKQIQDDSLDLEKIKAGTKVLPSTATLGSAKTVAEIDSAAATTLVTKEYVTAKITAADTKLESAAGEGLAWDEPNNQLDVKADGTSITVGVSGIKVSTSGVTNDMLAGSIADTKLSTISTAGKVSNSATTATAANTTSAIVARDASGNFTANLITIATPTADAHAATKLYVDNAVTSGTANAVTTAVMIELTNGTCTGTGIQAYTGVVTLVGTPKTDATVYVNGVKVRMTEIAFFGTDTITKRSKPQSGDSLYFDLTELGYTLDAIDLIEITYHI